jgi:uncharacterized protein (DUF2062 family)
MPRRFFRKFAFNRREISQQWYVSPFRHLLHNPAYWGVRRKTVVPGFSLGLFVAFLPFPGHTVALVLMALMLRVSIPAGILGTLVSNPVTMVPMLFLAYRVGLMLLGVEPQPFDPELSWQWLTDGFLNVWQPLLLGSVLLGALASLVGFIGLDLLWRASLANYLATRQRRNSAKESRLQERH